MPEIKREFTEGFIESIKPTKSTQIYSNKSNCYLKLYVRPSGAKSYFLRTKLHGNDVKRKLGDVDTMSLSMAKVLAETYINNKKTKSKDLVSQLTSQLTSNVTIDHIFQLYKANELSLRSTIAGRTHGFDVAYNMHLKSEIGNYSIEELNKKFARNLFKKMETKGYATHNKLLSCMKSAFNYVIDYEDGFEQLINPFDRIKKMEGVNRNRYLTHQEASKLLEALKQVANQDVADIYRLALFTGARLSNVKQMLWSDINLASATWLIPATQTKTRQHYEIPLHKLVIDILFKRQKAVGNSKFVFPSRNKSKYGYITGGDPIWKKAIKLAGLYHENPNIRPRPHDLRRTFATWQIQSGTDISIVSKSLCHTSLKHTMIYAHTNSDQVRDAINGAFDFLE